MKKSYEKMDSVEREKITSKIEQAQPMIDGHYMDMSIWWVDENFEPVGDITEVRWMYASNYHDDKLMRVDAIGEVTIFED